MIQRYFVQRLQKLAEAMALENIVLAELFVNEVLIEEKCMGAA